MMGNTPFSVALGMHIHVVFVVAALAGLILRMIWAVKYLKADKLHTWSLLMVLVGILGMLITSQWSMMGQFGFFQSRVDGISKAKFQMMGNWSSDDSAPRGQMMRNWSNQEETSQKNDKTTKGEKGNKKYNENANIAG